MKAFLRALVPPKLKPQLRAAYQKLYYWGFRYTCPFCRSHLRTFLPFGFKFPVLEAQQVIGGGYRPKASCPICGSRDRERLLYLFLLHKTDLFEKHTKILHVAPEGQLSRVLRSHRTVDYVSADFHSTRVMVKMDITAIQFPEEYFEGIICNHVLEHVVDDRKAMAELYRTLTPGGWAILQVPISLRLDRTYEDPSITTTAGREAAFGQHDHVRIYASDYAERLEQAGFNVDVFSWMTEAKDFGGFGNRFGLNQNEAVYFATKPVRGCQNLRGS